MRNNPYALPLAAAIVLCGLAMHLRREPELSLGRIVDAGWAVSRYEVYDSYKSEHPVAMFEGEGLDGGSLGVTLEATWHKAPDGGFAVELWDLPGVSYECCRQWVVR